MPNRGGDAAAFVALALLAALLVAGIPAAGVETRPSPGPLETGRYAYGAAVVDGVGYLVGGGTNETRYGTDLVRVDRHGEVSHAADLPTGLAEPGVAALAGKLYIFGGAQDGPGDLPRMTSDVHVFDPSTGQVEKRLDTSLPADLSSMAAVRHGAHIYLFGGLSIVSGEGESLTVDYKDTILRFDPGSGDVRTLNVRLPTGRAQLSAVSTPNGILLFGGMAEDDGTGDLCADPPCVVAQALRFTPDGNGGTLARLDDLPRPVRWAAVAQAEGHVYLMGGCGDNCGPFGGQDAILRIDPETGEVEELPAKMPTKGGRRQALTFNKLALLPGGAQPNPSYNPARNPGEPPSVPGRAIHAVALGATRPFAPTGLTVEAASEGGARLSWNPPAYDGGAPLTTYEVHRARGSGEPVRLGEVEASQTTFVDQSARLGTTYSYLVRATNQAGVSAFSNAAAITPSAVPGAPTLSAQGGDQKVVVQWTPPEETGGLPIEAYRLLAYPEGEAEAPWGELTGRYVVVRDLGDGSALENGRSYLFRVQARNGNGWGDLSAPVTATPSDVPEEPTGLTAEPVSLGAGQAVNLSWTPSANADVTGYRLYRGVDLDRLAPIGEAAGTSFTDAGDLPHGETVHYGVTALAGGKESPLSQLTSVTFASPPGAVEALGARWTGTEVTVWWEAPAEKGGGEVTGYQIARTRGAIDPATANATLHDAPRAPWSDPDPPRGVQLAYHVRAVGTGGPGPWSWVSVKVPAVDDSRPPAAALSADPSTAKVGQTVTFDASHSSDDEGVVAYDLDFGDGSSTGWTTTPRMEHAYTAAGVYEATLTVRDLRGLESLEPATVVVAIGPAPQDKEDAPEPTGPGQGNDAPLAWVLAVVGLALAARRRRP